MPANRSRTHEWRRCLKQVWERGGSLEIAVANNAEKTDQPHLVWRVRLLNVSETEILVEQPSALGHAIDIRTGIDLVVVMSIGQNRWMFATRTLSPAPVVHAERKMMPTMRLAMPKKVERCQRRNHNRVDTATLNLPQVEIWPLLDPKSVIVAERACELRAQQSAESCAAKVGSDELTLPEVGPKFAATLVNLGGGGVGLRVAGNDSQALARHKIFWMRLLLPVSGGTNLTSICATGKLVHTHMESNHDTYAGLAFDFSFNPAHQRFVVDQISRYVALQQRDQLDDLEEDRATAAA